MLNCKIRSTLDCANFVVLIAARRCTRGRCGDEAAHQVQLRIDLRASRGGLKPWLRLVQRFIRKSSRVMRCLGSFCALELRRIRNFDQRLNHIACLTTSHIKKPELKTRDHRVKSEAPDPLSQKKLALQALDIAHEAILTRSRIQSFSRLARRRFLLKPHDLIYGETRFQ